MKAMVLGGGPGGYVCAIRLAQLGAEVTLVEKEKLGGTCLNVGCIPTKALLQSAELYETFHKESAVFGLKAEKLSYDWKAIQKRKEGVVNQLVQGVGSLLKSNGVTVIYGKGKFTGANELTVETAEGTKKVAFDSAVIATGSVPKVPPIPGVETEGVITSNGALALEEVPKSLCIVGGGVIGCEFAGLYSALGTEVTIVEALDAVAATMDKDISAQMRKQLEGAGVKIYTSAKVQGFKPAKGGVEVSVEAPAGAMKVTAEKVLLAIGRGAKTDDIGLDVLGIETVRGNITVDPKTMRTRQSNIYAIGDCIGGIQLAHVASAEGTVAAESLMGMKSKMRLDIVPSGIYTRPEIGSVGMTEAQAKEKGYKVKTGMFPLMANGKSLVMNEYSGFVKFVTDSETDEILGLHMVGPRATDLIGEGALAIRLEATIEEIVTTIHGHPTVSESLHEAAHAVHGLALHMPKVGR